MFFRHHSDKLVIPVILGAALFASSYRGKYHLKTDMPPAFFEQNQRTGNPTLDQKIAWAYWETALMNVQWKYPYSHPLPVDPPPEFTVDAKALGASASDPSTRLLYWHHLQRVWYTRETWQKDYGWDFSWLGSPLESGGNWLRNAADRLFSVH